MLKRRLLTRGSVPTAQTDGQNGSDPRRHGGPNTDLVSRPGAGAENVLAVRAGPNVLTFKNSLAHGVEIERRIILLRCDSVACNNPVATMIGRTRHFTGVSAAANDGRFSSRNQVGCEP